MKQIPILGQSAQEVLKNALNYDRAGYLLKFEVVFEGSWQYNFISNKFEKVKYPVVERVESDSFDSWLLGQIGKGFVSIFIQSPGKNPFYFKEIHRATARQIPIE